MTETIEHVLPDYGILVFAIGVMVFCFGGAYYVSRDNGLGIPLIARLGAASVLACVGLSMCLLAATIVCHILGI